MTSYSSNIKSQPPQQQATDQGLDRIGYSIAQINSNNPIHVIDGLNFILQRSSESTTGNVLYIENYIQLPIALGNLLNTINPLGNILFTDVSSDRSYSHFLLDKLVHPQWSPELLSNGNKKIQILAIYLDENEMLLTTLCIIRNLSFEPTNEQILAQSSVILRHVVSILMASIETYSVTNTVTQLAFDIIINLGSKIDTTGRKRINQYNSFLEYITLNQNKINKKSTYNHMNLQNQSILKLSDHFSATSSYEYLQVTNSLLSIILCFLNKQNQSRIPRVAVIRTLEFLSRFALCNENNTCFSNCPTSLLESLVDLLCVNYTIADPLTPPFGNNKNKHPISILTQSYFGSELSDFEIRDLSLEAIHSMCLLSSNLILRFGNIPNAVEILLKIGKIASNSALSGSSILMNDLPQLNSTVTNTTTTNNNNNNLIYNIKTEGNHRAIQILGLMFSQSALVNKYFQISSDLYIAASCDPDIADVVCVKASQVYATLATSTQAIANNNQTGPILFGVEGDPGH
eukprot:gene16280-22177_t